MITMKKIQKHIGSVLMAVTMLIAMPALLLTSCSDDDLVKTPLPVTSITEGAKTVSTLNFTWEPIAGATQYAYELAEKSTGTVVLGGITNTTSLLATNLKTNTTYLMTVWAYAAVSASNTTSPKITIEATTNDVVTLATPSNIESGWDGGTITITWPAVANADGYEYQYEKDGETVTGTVTTNTLSISGLPIGEYTVYLRAITNDENYTNSQPIAFSFKREKLELWRTECNYNSPVLDKDFTCQVVAFDDGNFEIQGIYGSDDKIEFNADENGEIVLLNPYEVNPPYYYLHAGDYTLCVYIGSGYSGVECTREYGDIWFYVYLYDKDGNYINGDYDSITWGSSEEVPIVDALVGDYTETTSCYDMTYDWASWTEVTGQQSEVSIEKVDDETITIYNFYGWESTLTAKVDMANHTITIDNNALFADYYTVADCRSADKAVVGTFDDTYTITFTNWSIWYGGYAYIYQGAVSTLQKK